MYKYLIEKENSETFKTKVKPNLNIGDKYFKVYLQAEDDIMQHHSVVGFGYHCSLNQLKSDLRKWLDEEVDGYGCFYITTKQLQADNKIIALDGELY